MCGKTKSISQFYKHPFNKSGRDTRCKECSKAYNNQWSEANKERKRELVRNCKRRSRQYHAPLKTYPSRQEHTPEQRERWLFNHRTKSYGITVAQYKQMLEEQKGLCAICGEPDPDGKRLSIDHDHDTGTVRGLLCNKCNLGLGYFRDSAKRLARAAIYLETASLHKESVDTVSFLAGLEKSDGG